MANIDFDKLCKVTDASCSNSVKPGGDTCNRISTETSTIFILDQWNLPKIYQCYILQKSSKVATV